MVRISFRNVSTFALSATLMLLGPAALAQRASDPMAPTELAQTNSNEKMQQPPRTEETYPLANEQDREKTS